jgi:hypothetical protein
MGIIEILVTVVFTVAIGVGVAITTSATSATTNAEFWVARGCFGLAGAALLAAYFIWLWNGPRDPSWRVLLGALLGILAVPGATEAVLWVNFRQQQSQAQQVGQEAAQLATVIQALRDSQNNLRNQQAANVIVGQILWQYDHLIAGVGAIEKFSGTPDEKDRVASALHTIETLKVLLGSVQVVATRQGSLLIIKTAPNTFRVTFAVPMRIAPAIACHAPPGVTVNELEKTNIGVTLVFTPASIPIEKLPPCEFSAEL